MCPRLMSCAILTCMKFKVPFMTISLCCIVCGHLFFLRFFSLSLYLFFSFFLSSHYTRTSIRLSALYVVFFFGFFFLSLSFSPFFPSLQTRTATRHQSLLHCMFFFFFLMHAHMPTCTHIKQPLKRPLPNLHALYHTLMTYILISYSYACTHS